MTTYKKQLKDKDGNIIYPDVGIDLDKAVYSDNPEAVTLEPWVDTTEIVDEAVTAEKIDWSGIPTIVGSENNICYKFPNGIMIACVRKTATATFDTWSGMSETEVIFPPNYATAFISVPCCTVSLEGSNLQCWVMNGSGRTSSPSYAGSSTRAQGVVLGRAGGTTSSVTVTLSWLAIGRWK